MNGRDERRYLLTNSDRRTITPPVSHDSFHIPSRQTVQPTDLATPTNRTTQPVQLAAPYNQTHQPTSNPVPKPAPSVTTLQGNPTITYSAIEAPRVNQPKPQPTAAPVAQQKQVTTQTNQATTQSAAMTEAQRQYHTAWQNYYQKYYENYYMAALQEQEKRFKEQQAAVVDSREQDGVLEQQEVQQRLTSDVLNKVEQGVKKAKSKIWFYPTIVAIIIILIFLFLQYNSVIAAKIAAFVSPGSSSSQTIIVGTGSNTPISTESRIIIPKINVNAPVTYGLTSLDENTVQTALQNGPINYPVAGATAVPGQKGNTVILGHSSADVFAPGNYKFIFVQLNRLAVGDLFYLDYGKTRYTYKITETKVINPDQISALNLGTDKPYATLVTCDPPGTIARRLLVIAEQVSPNPNQAAAEQKSDATPATTITGKPKTLLESIFGGK